MESLQPEAVISQICGRILNRFASWLQPYFGVHIPLEEHQNIYQSQALDLLRNCLCPDKMADVNSVVNHQPTMIWLKTCCLCPD